MIVNSGRTATESRCIVNLVDSEESMIRKVVHLPLDSGEADTAERPEGLERVPGPGEAEQRYHWDRGMIQHFRGNHLRVMDQSGTGVFKTWVDKNKSRTRQSSIEPEDELDAHVAEIQAKIAIDQVRDRQGRPMIDDSNYGSIETYFLLESLRLKTNIECYKVLARAHRSWQGHLRGDMLLAASYCGSNYHHLQNKNEVNSGKPIFFGRVGPTIMCSNHHQIAYDPRQDPEEKHVPEGPGKRRIYYTVNPSGSCFRHSPAGTLSGYCHFRSQDVKGYRLNAVRNAREGILPKDKTGKMNWKALDVSAITKRDADKSGELGAKYTFNWLLNTFILAEAASDAELTNYMKQNAMNVPLPLLRKDHSTYHGKAKLGESVRGKEFRDERFTHAFAAITTGPCARAFRQYNLLEGNDRQKYEKRDKITGPWPVRNEQEWEDELESPVRTMYDTETEHQTEREEDKV